MKSDLQLAFEKFHVENPDVWGLFQKYAFEARNAGRNRFSSDAVFHRIRWDVETMAKCPRKLSNNHTAYYARLFAQTYPWLRNFFVKRPVRQG